MSAEIELKKQKLVSIILPIYNIQEYLERCMESVLEQTYKNIEIVMVDDGSQDGCPDICDTYSMKDKRVRVFHKENGGLSDARNYGIERATGEYITCVDPDDYIDLDYIEYLVMLIEKYDTDISICQHRTIYENGKIRDFGDRGCELMSTRICLKRMLYHDVIDTSAWAKLYRRNLFLCVKYPVGKIFEDIGTTYALMLQCEEIAVGYESKYNYIFHDNSIVNSDFKISKLDMLEMTDKMAEDVLKKYPDLDRAVLRRCVYSRLSTLNQMLDTTKCKKEREDIIIFIKKNRKQILRDKFAPKRDKIAVILLSFSYRLYRYVWHRYKKNIMKKER